MKFKNLVTIALIIFGLYLIFDFRDHNFKRAIDACVAGSQKLEKPDQRSRLWQESFQEKYQKGNKQTPLI